MSPKKAATRAAPAIAKAALPMIGSIPKKTGIDWSILEDLLLLATGAQDNLDGVHLAPGTIIPGRGTRGMEQRWTDLRDNLPHMIQVLNNTLVNPATRQEPRVPSRAARKAARDAKKLAAQKAALSTKKNAKQ